MSKMTRTKRPLLVFPDGVDLVEHPTVPVAGLHALLQHVQLEAEVGLLEALPLLDEAEQGDRQVQVPP